MMTEREFIEILDRICDEQVNARKDSKCLLLSEQERIRAYEEIGTFIKVFKEEYRDQPNQAA